MDHRDVFETWETCCTLREADGSGWITFRSVSCWTKEETFLCFSSCRFSISLSSCCHVWYWKVGSNSEQRLEISFSFLVWESVLCFEFHLWTSTNIPSAICRFLLHACLHFRKLIRLYINYEYVWYFLVHISILKCTQIPRVSSYVHDVCVLLLLLSTDLLDSGEAGITIIVKFFTSQWIQCAMKTSAVVKILVSLVLILHFGRGEWLWKLF